MYDGRHGVEFRGEEVPLIPCRPETPCCPKHFTGGVMPVIILDLFTPRMIQIDNSDYYDNGEA